MAIFDSFLYVYQRVSHGHGPFFASPLAWPKVSRLLVVAGVDPSASLRRPVHVEAAGHIL